MKKFLYKQALGSEINCIEVLDFKKLRFYCDVDCKAFSQFVKIADNISFSQCKNCGLWFFKTPVTLRFNVCGQHYMCSLANGLPDIQVAMRIKRYI